MKSVPKLIRRFVGIMMLSFILLFILNIAFYALVFVRNTSTVSAWDMADKRCAGQYSDAVFFVRYSRADTRLCRRVPYLYRGSPGRIAGIGLSERQLLETYKGKLGLRIYSKFSQERDDCLICQHSRYFSYLCRR